MTMVGVQKSGKTLQGVKKSVEAKVSSTDNTAVVDSWRAFFADCRKISRRKKRKLKVERNRRKREEEEAKEMEIQMWLKLYEQRLDSDENWDEYCMTPVPEGAWGRVN